MPPAGSTVRYAGLGLRAVAVILDTLVLFALIWVVGLATGHTTDDGVSMQGAVTLLPMGLWGLYYVGLEATLGATLGKLALGLRVVDLDGRSPIGWRSSLARNCLRAVDGLFGYLVGALLVRTSPSRQRLGDRVAGTVVVRRALAPAGG
jgi:uncharacterized RDD family membrane protein YckC